MQVQLALTGLPKTPASSLNTLPGPDNYQQYDEPYPEEQYEAPEEENFLQNQDDVDEEGKVVESEAAQGKKSLTVCIKFCVKPLNVLCTCFFYRSCFLSIKKIQTQSRSTTERDGPTCSCARRQIARILECRLWYRCSLFFFLSFSLTLSLSLSPSLSLCLSVCLSVYISISILFFIIRINTLINLSIYLSK
jgi:hypothetical protein